MSEYVEQAKQHLADLQARKASGFWIAPHEIQAAEARVDKAERLAVNQEAIRLTTGLDKGQIEAGMKYARAHRAVMEAKLSGEDLEASVVERLEQARERAEKLGMSEQQLAIFQQTYSESIGRGGY
jgi:hypothetical protein